MGFENNDNFDEFYWEREFRKDDTRIAFCMHELPAVIDLPEEDELLMKRLQKRPEYAVNKRIQDESGFDEFLDFDEILFPDNWRERDGASLYTRVERMMKEWATMYASKLETKENDIGIQILCFYGKIMGFSIDMVDIGEEKMPGLKIALCKRIVSEINNIAAALNSIGKSSTYISSHLESLQQLRHEVLTMLFRLKNEAARN